MILLLLVGAGATYVLVFTSRTEQTNTSSPPTPDPTPGTSADRSPTDNPTLDGLPEITEGDPDLRTGVLANGLTYYIRDNDNPGGSAELRLVVDAGSSQETAEQSGVAHFLEHMLFNGTTRFPKNELIDILRNSGSQFGSDVNAYTSYDETVYQLTMPSRDATTLNTGLDVLAEWLSTATLDPQEVIAERGVVLDEWRSRGETSDGRIETALQHMFLAGSVYEQHAPIGTAAAIEQMSPELLRDFYDSFYRPDNAAVVVIGDIDVDAVLAGIEARFGPVVSRSTDPLPAHPPLNLSTHPTPAVITDPDLTSRVVELTLPMVTDAESIPDSSHQIADTLIFSIIANRLNDDALGGEQPFDHAYVSDNNFVRPLDAPSVVVEPKVGQTDQAMLALLDEFERGPSLRIHRN